MKKKNKIEKISTKLDEEGYYCATNEDFMNKINELIDKVNDLESKIDKPRREKLLLRWLKRLDKKVDSLDVKCISLEALVLDLQDKDKPKPSTQFGH